MHPSGYATVVLDAELGTSSYEGPDDSMQCWKGSIVFLDRMSALSSSRMSNCLVKVGRASHNKSL